MTRGERVGAAVRAAALVGLGLAGAGGACALLGPGASLPRIEGASAVGSETCLSCHTDVGDAYAGSAHGAILGSRPESCETCHGAGSKHAESFSKDDILSAERMRGLDPAQRSATCLACHARDAGHYPLGEHAAAGLSCWDCHGDALHALPPDVERRSAPLPSQGRGRARALASPRPGTDRQRFCESCHGSVAADFLLRSHHPVPEGRMDCGDCHAAHGPAEDEARADARCLSCHPEIRGPYVFEHLALEDGCTACHTPHGSIVEKLLVQSGNALCERCHFDARYPLIGGVDHTPLLSGGALCVDCHLQVHGSNTDENLNPLRIEERLRRGRRSGS